MTRYNNFINGEWRAPATGAYDPNTNPAKPQEVLGEFARSGPEDVDAAVAAAAAALPAWAETPGPARGALLYKLADLLEKNKEELGKIITLEQGKGLGEGIGEVGRAAVECRFMAGEASRAYGTTFPSERAGFRVASVQEPLGVVALISPWNFPVVTPVRKMAPALAYGCTVVAKPASLTPWASVRIWELVQEAGFPKGVANLVLGGGGSVGQRLVDHPEVAGISFTGSTVIGTRLYQGAAKRVARVQLELGGKNPAIVWNYADLDHAATEISAAAFACTGQRCTALSRVIVGENQADALVEKLKARMEAIKVGDGTADKANMGPLVSLDQLEIVERYVEIGRKAGLKLVTGGKRLTEDPQREGFFYAPTLFDHVPASSPLAKEEIFGPVLPVIRVKSVDEAIAIANDVEYGLASAAFTDDFKAANKFQKALMSGMVHINHGTASQAHVPFGGIKQSGEGAYSIGTSAREFYTRLKVVYVKE
jgi:acyl-CoA reductase-like NAD-dependent aldehyde dehydrogenase